MLKNVVKNLEGKHLYMDYTNALVGYLSENGFSEKFGARPLRRLIENKVEDLIADLYIKGDIKENDKFTVDIKDDEVVINK